MMHRPAYAPQTFMDRPISWTLPYSMPGELIVAPNSPAVQFPEAQFLHNIDKPFEIWRMIVRVTGLVGGDGVPENATIIDTQPATLAERLRLSILDTSKNEKITKNPQLVSSLQKANELTWEWDPRPYTIVRNEGLQVQVTSNAYPTICAPDPEAEQPCDLAAFPITFVRLAVTFQGYLLVVEQASNMRG